MSSDLNTMRLKVALWQTACLNFLLFLLNEKSLWQNTLLLNEKGL